MNSIFKYTDRDKDRLDVALPENGDPVYAGGLMFHNARHDNEVASVALPRDQVLSLIQALSEWAYPVHTPEGPNRSLIEELIAKAVKDQVAAVLPLHLASFATQMQAAEDKIGRVANALVTDPEPRKNCSCDCGAALHRDFGCVRCSCEGGPDRPPLRCGFDCSNCNPDDDDDPEPHDVGHAEPPLLSLHMATESECRGDSQNSCTASRHLPEIEAEHGRLMSELPRRTRPRLVPACVECMHSWGEHTSGVCWGTSQTPEGVGCICTRERPEASAL